MGYILPIRPIQSEQYANRLNMEKYDFASVEKVSEVKLDADFLEQMKERIHLLEQADRESNRDESNSEEQSDSSSSLYQGYIAPNPANLSPAISHVVGKGIAINVYA